MLQKPSKLTNEVEGRKEKEGKGEGGERKEVKGKKRGMEGGKREGGREKESGLESIQEPVIPSDF